MPSDPSMNTAETVGEGKQMITRSLFSATAAGVAAVVAPNATRGAITHGAQVINANLPIVTPQRAGHSAADIALADKADSHVPNALLVMVADYSQYSAARGRRSIATSGRAG